MKYNEIPTTLDGIWSECIRMHTDAMTQTDSEDGPKVAWMVSNDYKLGKIAHNCFFCQYAKDNDVEHVSSPDSMKGCPSCPGVLVDPEFNCMDIEYDYIEYDGKFVDKLNELNKQRLEIDHECNKENQEVVTE